MISYNPQMIQKEVVDPFFIKWDLLSKQIYEAHDARNGQARELMEIGIKLYEELIYAVSNADSTSIPINEEFEVLPINGAERSYFIKARPGQYACYRQLEELFKETKKRLARFRVKGK